MTNYKIQKLTSKQAVNMAEAIVSVYRDCWINTYPNEQLGITVQDIEQRFINFPSVVGEWKRDILSQNNRAIWIVKKAAGNIGGFCVAKKSTDHNELECIYLLTDCQGKGLGKKLLTMAFDWMGQSKPIVLYGAAYNYKAIAFYQKHGFKLAPPDIPPKVMPSGKSMPPMKMVKNF